MQHQQKISERAFDGLNVLRRLRLEDNKLSHLEPGVFTGVPALRYLNLANNRLTSITFNNILPLWDNLVNISSTLDLTGTWQNFDYLIFFVLFIFYFLTLWLTSTFWEWYFYQRNIVFGLSSLLLTYFQNFERVFERS